MLNKGLSFCPTDKIDDFQLFIDLNIYIRKLTVARHFAIKDKTNPHNIDTVNPNAETEMIDNQDPPPPTPCHQLPKTIHPQPRPFCLLAAASN